MKFFAKNIKCFATGCVMVAMLAISAAVMPSTVHAADIKPINKMKLVYPRRALQRGIEGYVELEFTVTAAGTTADIAVKDSKPSKIFDKAAIKAIKKLKYEPQPQDVQNVSLKVTFKLS